MDLEAIFKEGRTPQEIISDLKEKSVIIPAWNELERNYDPRKHEILINKELRPKDKKKNGQIEKAARLTYSAEMIVTRRMTQMAFTIPVERKYETGEDDDKKQQANAIESVYRGVRINGVNKDRMKAYFASCEMCSVWYVVKDPHDEYGFESDFKLKCRSYSPMPSRLSKITQAELYPLYDEYDDMIAFSIQYIIRSKNVDTTYFDTYTKDAFYRWKNSQTGQFEQVEITPLKNIGKIPVAYLWRPAPIYEGISNNRNEIEFTLSRTSDIIRKNSSPIVKVCGNIIGDKPVGDTAREVYQMEQGGDVNLVTPALSSEATKFYIDQLKQNIEEDTQLPNLSMENIKGLGAISGEARKTLLTDAHLKVGEEKDDIIWFLERECNIIKAFLGEIKVSWKNSIRKLKVTHHITPFIQNDKATKVSYLTSATQGPIMSRKTAVEELGIAKNVDEEINAIIADEERETESRRIVDIFEGAQ